MFITNRTIGIILQIQYYSIYANASYTGASHREGYVEGAYIDGDSYYFYETPIVSTKAIFEIVTYRGKKTRVEIKQGTCIVFENNTVHYRLKALTDENKDDIIVKSGVLRFFLPKVKIICTSDTINISNLNSNFYKREKSASYWVRQFNNKSGAVVSVNKNIEMIIVEYLYVIANEKDLKQRNKLASTKNT